jgi:phosphonate metabolism protein PhnN/1,5-bisphosphokinase (PRPP-forming)
MGSCGEGQGVLILVTGPSGAGKDTLICAAMRVLADDPAFYFPKRLITRTDRAGEKHIPITHREFDAMRKNNRFFLDWDAYGYSYGILANVLDELTAGRTVVCNVSRNVAGAARLKWQRTHVILVAAEPEVLRERLRARGRESAAEIEARVARAHSGDAIAEPVKWLDNSGLLDRSISQFLGLLRTLSAT